MCSFLLQHTKRYSYNNNEIYDITNYSNYIVEANYSKIIYVCGIKYITIDVYVYEVKGCLIYVVCLTTHEDCAYYNVVAD